MTTPREHLTAMFQAALDRVDPYAMLMRHVALHGGVLAVDMPGQSLRVDLADFDRVLVLGAGKGSAPMAKALEDILGDRLSGGLVIVKYGHGVELGRVEIAESAHPVPDQAGVHAARKLAGLASGADERTLVLCCVSGGGSALAPLPAEDLTLEDKQRTTGALLASGADISEINCVRKHLSGLKGGGFLRLLAPARSVSFILSDVIGDDLGTIASGMTAADATTFGDALSVLDTHGLRADVPRAVVRVLERGASGGLPETVKPGDAVLDLTDNILLGTNRQALLAAADTAQSLGYNVVKLTARLSGEARSAATVLADVARDAAESGMLVHAPACLLWGGETVVTLRGNGKGGRNQELALAFLKNMAGWDADIAARVSLLAASTDGTDGPTDAAGAFADVTALRAAQSLNFNILNFLENNDSYHFHQRAGSLHRTGPTRTNVCDLQIILIRQCV